MANRNMVYVTLATRYLLFNNIVTPEANDISYPYVSNDVESDT